MKQRRFALATALVFVLALAGCSANREENSAPVEPTNNAPSGNVQHTPGAGGDAQNSPGMSGGAEHSPGMNGGNNGNDAMEGGGAGGTNDLDNNGLPDGAAGSGGQDGDSVIDDIGDAAGDLARGAGDVVRGAGDAIGDAANDVGRAMK